jgi:hypothetical protein
MPGKLSGVPHKLSSLADGIFRMHGGTASATMRRKSPARQRSPLMPRTTLLGRCLAALLLSLLVFGLVLLAPSSAAPAPERVEGKDWGKEVTNSIGMKLVRIPAGKFMMGSSKKEQDEAIASFETTTGKKASGHLVALCRAEGPRHLSPEVEIGRRGTPGADPLSGAGGQGATTKPLGRRGPSAAVSMSRGSFCPCRGGVSCPRAKGAGRAAWARSCWAS